MGDRTTVATVGARGPLLLSDFPYIEDVQRFDRERIPERVVHAKGWVVFLALLGLIDAGCSCRGGAFGFFEALDDISDICKAKVFKRGSKTRVVMRFSTVGEFSRE